MFWVQWLGFSVQVFSGSFQCPFSAFQCFLGFFKVQGLSLLGFLMVFQSILGFLYGFLGFRYIDTQIDRYIHMFRVQWLLFRVQGFSGSFYCLFSFFQGFLGFLGSIYCLFTVFQCLLGFFMVYRVQINRQIDRQTDRQTDRQSDRQTDRHKYRQTNRQTDRQIDRQVQDLVVRVQGLGFFRVFLVSLYCLFSVFFGFLGIIRVQDLDRQIDRQTDRQTDRQRDRQTDGQTDTKTD